MDTAALHMTAMAKHRQQVCPCFSTHLSGFMLSLHSNFYVQIVPIISGMLNFTRLTVEDTLMPPLHHDCIPTFSTQPCPDGSWLSLLEQSSRSTSGLPRLCPCSPWLPSWQSGCPSFFSSLQCCLSTLLCYLGWAKPRWPSGHR